MERKKRNKLQHSLNGNVKTKTKHNSKRYNLYQGVIYYKSIRLGLLSEVKTSLLLVNTIEGPSYPINIFFCKNVTLFELNGHKIIDPQRMSKELPPVIRVYTKKVIETNEIKPLIISICHPEIRVKIAYTSIFTKHEFTKNYLDYSKFMLSHKAPFQEYNELIPVSYNNLKNSYYEYLMSKKNEYYSFIYPTHFRT